MVKAIIILILFCIIGFGIGSCIGQYNINRCIYKRTYNKDVSLDRGCEGGICPAPEEYKNGSD